jgi:hypothetical protein
MEKGTYVLDKMRKTKIIKIVMLGGKALVVIQNDSQNRFWGA